MSILGQILLESNNPEQVLAQQDGNSVIGADGTLRGRFRLVRAILMSWTALITEGIESFQEEQVNGLDPEDFEYQSTSTTTQAVASGVQSNQSASLARNESGIVKRLSIIRLFSLWRGSATAIIRTVYLNGQQMIIQLVESR
jgi:hypothetical protein